MLQGSEVFEEKSPSASTDPLSGSTSPHMIRPTPAATQRQRSSSINSNASVQSTNFRSLSIASLESPRNSIVSIDDFRVSTRNNSSTSVNSLGASGMPSNPLRAFLGQVSSKLRDSPSVFDDTDEDIQTPSTSTPKKPENRFDMPRKVDRPEKPERKDRKTDKLTIKSDYRFKFKEIIKPKPTLDTKNVASPVGDSTPSPLSLTANEIIPKKTIEQNRENYKKKTTSRQVLKKSLIFSKDLRMEVANNKLDFQSKFPKPESDKLPLIDTLKHQNQLISKLNRKWNKEKPESDEKSRSKRRYLSDED